MSAASAFVLKAKAIIIGLSLVLGAVPGLAWPGLLRHCMPKFWGHKTAKHANTHRQQRCRHQARGVPQYNAGTLAHGDTDTNTGKVRSLSFNSLAALTFCRVCTSQQGESAQQRQRQRQQKKNRKTRKQLYGCQLIPPKCHALSHSPSVQHSPSPSPSRRSRHPILPHYTCMFDELIKARARLNFKSMPFPV